MSDFILVPEPDLIAKFLQVCPEFNERWREHIAYWGKEKAGPYNDLAQLARFIVDSYEVGNLGTVTKALDLTESLLQERDPQTTQLLTVGLIEDIQTIASNRPFGKDVFIEFLGPLSKE